MFLAWKEFRRGKKKKPEVQQFEFNLEDNLFQLRRDLKAKIYRPDSYAAFYIRDPKLRHIHKASVRDRVLHQAVFRILYPIFDQSLIFDVYSARLDKGTHAAVDRLNQFLNKISQNNRRNIFALKCDISKFFDSVDHGILLDLIKNKISEPNCVWLIETIVKSFEKLPSKGLPLGNVTSQLFANIYLNELDQFVKHHLKIRYYLRYCDDFVILDRDRNLFPKIISELENFLDKNLKLKLHPNKIIIRKHSQGIDFLGYVCRPYNRLLRTKTKWRMLKRIKHKNLASYLGVLKHCKGYKIEKKIFSDIIKRMKTLLLIDANALIHRFFHALPPFTGPEGQPTNALYGLSGMLLKIFREQKPDYIAAAFDRPEKTFREEQFEQYKIHRPPAAPELVSQIIKAHDVFHFYKIKTFETPGFEADDIIATLTENFKKEPNLQVVILSGDLDNLQLVEGETVVAQIIKTGVTETILYDETAVEKRYGLKPNQLPDYKGLVGDVSDNIPGVNGVGPKTASTLLKEFGTLENVFENIAIVNKSAAKKLEGHREEALFSKKLATMRRDAPVSVKNLEELKAQPLDKESLKEHFQKLGFKSLIERLEK